MKHSLYLIPRVLPRLHEKKKKIKAAFGENNGGI
jgi:hypothetical protein